MARRHNQPPVCRMKMQILRCFAASAAALCLTACAGSSAQHRYVSPTVLAADGTTASLPLGNVYPLFAADVPPDAAAAICQAAGTENTADALNTVWFGENIFGAGLAAAVYFGKDAASLSAGEWALLAEIAAAPERFSDVLTGGDLPDPRLNPDAASASRIAGSAYFDAMTEEIIRDIMAAQNCSRADAFTLLYAEGVTVETPFSPDVQRAVNTVYSDDANFSDGDSAVPQSACAVLDLRGNVLAVAAGIRGDTACNRAYRMLHPAGNALRPLSVYAPAFAAGMINFSSLVDAAPTRGGKITVAEALCQADDTAALQLCKALKPENCLDFMHEKLGFTTLTPADASVQAMAAGAPERGVSLAELAAAYQIFGNGGTYTAPRFYTRVTDRRGKVLASCEPETVQALESPDAWIMNRLLCMSADHDMVRLDDGSEICGMNGTANLDDGTDGLFVGLTPAYTAAVWVGCTAPGTAYTLPCTIWKQIMELTARQQMNFVPVSGAEAAEYCTKSGLRACEGCPETETGYYREGAVPEPCTLHRKP